MWFSPTHLSEGLTTLRTARWPARVSLLSTSEAFYTSCQQESGCEWYPPRSISTPKWNLWCKPHSNSGTFWKSNDEFIRWLKDTERFPLWMEEVLDYLACALSASKRVYYSFYVIVSCNKLFLWTSISRWQGSRPRFAMKWYIYNWNWTSENTKNTNYVHMPFLSSI